jgi:hypothetical protein
MAKFMSRFLLGVLLFAVCYTAYVLIRVRQTVPVEIVGKPNGVAFECLVSQSSGKVEVMPWRVSPPIHSSIRITDIHPSGSTISYPSSDSDSTRLFVRWRDAERYGVLVRLRKGQWNLYWVAKSELTYVDGVAVFRLAKMPSVTVNEHLIAEWGFEPELTRKLEN